MRNILGLAALTAMIGIFAIANSRALEANNAPAAEETAMNVPGTCHANTLQAAHNACGDEFLNCGQVMVQGTGDIVVCSR